MKLIVNADDFGLTNGVTYGIMDGIQHGIVTSTTMMVNTPGTLTAAEIARQNTDMAVGLHINISLGSPLTRCPSLLKDGCFQKPAILGTDDGYRETELYSEIRAQYMRFLTLVGRKPTHLDSHLYAHQRFPKVGAAVQRLAEEEGLPIRDMATSGYPRVYFEGNFKVKPGENFAQIKEKCRQLLQELTNQAIAELMVHPAFIDLWLQRHSSYSSQRILEHAVLTDPDVRKYLSEAAVKPASFRDLE